MSRNPAAEREFLARIEQNQGILYRVATLYARGVEERRDLLQEILFQLWRSRDRFKGEAKLGTWIYRIALNTAISGLRQARRRPLAVPLDELPQAESRPGPATERDPRKDALEAAIRELPAVERALVLLHLEDRSYDEIAEILGISANHVGVKLTRIRHKLRVRLGE